MKTKKQVMVAALAVAGVCFAQAADVISDADAAQIGKTHYKTLQAAFDAAKDRDTITLLADIADAQAILSNAVKVVLDLNGKTMNCTTPKDPNPSYGFTIRVNAGQLTIDDSVGGGKILNNNDDSALRCCAPAGGEAACPMLIVKAGTFENNSKESGTVYVGPTDGAYVKILGGTFRNNSTPFVYGNASAVLNVADKMANSNEVLVVKGGSFMVDPKLGDDFVGVSYLAPDVLSICDEATGYYDVVPAAAKIDTTGYLTLKAACEAAQDGETITLVRSSSGDGITFDKSLTVDFAGYSYTVAGNPVGPADAEILAFHMLEGTTNTLMNGTLSSTAASGVKTLVQNHATLTLQCMTLNGANLVGTAPTYTLSTKNGQTTIDNCVVNARGKGDYAFDTSTFESSVVTNVVAQNGSVINGDIELTGGNLALKYSGVHCGAFNIEAMGSGVVTKDFLFDSYAPRGYRWGTDSMQGTLTKINYDNYSGGVKIQSYWEDEGIPSDVTIPKDWLEAKGIDPTYAKNAWACENGLTVAVSYVLGFDPKDPEDIIASSVILNDDGTISVQTTDKGASARPLEQKFKVTYSLYADDTPTGVAESEEPVVTGSEASKIKDPDTTVKSARFYRTTVTIENRQQP